MLSTQVTSSVTAVMMKCQSPRHRQRHSQTRCMPQKRHMPLLKRLMPLRTLKNLMLLTTTKRLTLPRRVHLNLLVALVTRPSLPLIASQESPGRISPWAKEATVKQKRVQNRLNRPPSAMDQCLSAQQLPTFLLPTKKITKTTTRKSKVRLRRTPKRC